MTIKQRTLPQQKEKRSCDMLVLYLLDPSFTFLWPVCHWRVLKCCPGSPEKAESHLQGESYWLPPEAVQGTALSSYHGGFHSVRLRKFVPTEKQEK